MHMSLFLRISTFYRLMPEGQQDAGESPTGSGLSFSEKRTEQSGILQVQFCPLHLSEFHILRIL